MESPCKHNESIKKLLTETMLLLCKNGIRFHSEFTINALIGITVDSTNIFLVNINETIVSSEIDPSQTHSVTSPLGKKVHRRNSTTMFSQAHGSTNSVYQTCNSDLNTDVGINLNSTNVSSKRSFEGVKKDNMVNVHTLCNETTFSQQIVGSNKNDTANMEHVDNRIDDRKYELRPHTVSESNNFNFITEKSMGKSVTEMRPAAIIDNQILLGKDYNYGSTIKEEYDLKYMVHTVEDSVDEHTDNDAEFLVRGENRNVQDKNAVQDDALWKTNQVKQFLVFTM